MVTTFYPPYHFGGDATHTYRLSSELARRGHTVDVIFDRDAYYLARRGEPEQQYAQHPNITLHALKSPFGALSPLATQQTGRPWFKARIKHLLETGGYDVIHFHNSSLIGPGAFAYGRAVKLLSLHEYWLICPMHVLWKFDREACVHRQCLQCTLRGKRPPQWWRYTGFLPRQLAHIDQICAPSRFSRAQHQAHGIDAAIELLPNFVPPPADDPDATPAPHPRPYFLFVGRLLKLKGVQTLIPIFRRYPDADLLVVGDGEYGPALRAAARELPNIRFVGAVPFSQLGDYYRHAIALIVPSLCYETFALVQIEAFAWHTPVIAHRLGSTPEAVEDSGGGFTYGDEAELLNAMTQLQADPALRRALADKGWAAYRRWWDTDAHFKRYFELIARAQQKKQEVATSKASLP